MKVRSLRWRFYRKAGGPRGLGNRCGVYYPTCILCESYRLYIESGRFPTYEEAASVAGDHRPMLDGDGDCWVAWSVIEAAAAEMRV
jgi:hypothetical protein